MVRFVLTIMIALGTGVVGIANAATVSSSYLVDGVRAELKKKFPIFQVQLHGDIAWEAGNMPRSRIEKVTVLHEKRPGEMAIQVLSVDPRGGATATSVGSIQYTLLAKAWIPRQRAAPGSVLSPDNFSIQTVDVTRGLIAEVRGLILSPEEPVAGLEARNTLLEGSPVLTSAVQRVPNLRKGEMVRLKVIAGRVALTTQGMAEEPGYLNQKIRVTSMKTKRTLVGRLIEGGIVEVEL